MLPYEINAFGRRETAVKSREYYRKMVVFYFSYNKDYSASGITASPIKAHAHHSWRWEVIFFFSHSNSRQSRPKHLFRSPSSHLMPSMPRTKAKWRTVLPFHSNDDAKSATLIAPRGSVSFLNLSAEITFDKSVGANSAHGRQHAVGLCWRGCCRTQNLAYNTILGWWVRSKGPCIFGGGCAHTYMSGYVHYIIISSYIQTE